MFQAGERLSLDELKSRFADVPPPLGVDEARIEAARCLFCFDAPCTRACPTHIDVPRFIRQILHRDEIGSARTILEANIFGGSCARACPTEVLCEGACVDRTLMKAPVQIGRLQRFACDTAAARGIAFLRAGIADGQARGRDRLGPGRAVAVPTSCAGSGTTWSSSRHATSRAASTRWASPRTRSRPSSPSPRSSRSARSASRSSSAIASPASEVRELLDSFDAVFLGIGLGRTLPLGIEGEELEGVWEALDFIFQTHTKPLTECTVGRNVLVIGAGNTAIDVATAARRLGAETVTIAYRRSEALIPAFAYEYELARADGVRFEWFAQPVRVVGERRRPTGVEFVRTELEDPVSRSGRVKTLAGSNFVIPADMVVKALGQEPLSTWSPRCRSLKCERGKDRGRSRHRRDQHRRALCRRRLPAQRRRGRRCRAGRQDRGAWHSHVPLAGVIAR